MPMPRTWQASKMVTVRKERRKRYSRKRARKDTMPTFRDRQEFKLFKKWRASGTAKAKKMHQSQPTFEGIKHGHFPKM